MATVGLKNIYYVIVKADTAEATTYETPVKIGEAVSVELQYNSEQAKLHGDDKTVAVIDSFEDISITIETTDLPLKDQAALLGHTYESDTLIAKSTDSPPYVAIMFESDKHNGGTRCVKLLKGKFSPSQETFNTRGDSVEFQTPQLEGTFLARQSDNEWKKVKDYADGVSTADWYTSV